MDSATGSPYYVNVFTGVQWFTAEDGKGKIYFYEENGNESCWRLPSVAQTIQDSGEGVDEDEEAANATKRSPKRPLTGSTKRMADNYKSMAMADTASDTFDASSLKRQTSEGMTKTEMLERKKLTLPLSTPNFQIGRVSIVVVKQGPLHKTKLVENGKRTRKNWTAVHAVLTDTFLLFFKDAKAFAAMQQQQKQQKQKQQQSDSSGSNKPEHCVDLKGARVEWCAGDKSKRSNVFEVSTVLGLTVLMQDDSLQTAAEWFQEIKEVIEGLGDRSVGGGFFLIISMLCLYCFIYVANKIELCSPSDTNYYSIQNLQQS